MYFSYVSLSIVIFSLIFENKKKKQNSKLFIKNQIHP